MAITVQEGISKVVAFIKQSAKGTPGAGAGGQRLRRVTLTWQASRATFENNEIADHQQSTGITYGLKSVDGKLAGLLSSGTYSVLFGSLLRKLFVTGVNTGAIITVTSASTSGNQGTFTRSGGSYITDGFRVGDVVRWIGWATTGAANNARNMIIISLTALIMTVAAFDAGAIGAKAAGDSVTCTVAGKKVLAPTSGQVYDYYTWEDWNPDITKGELLTDVQVAKADVAMPATGNATLSMDLVGLARTLGTAQVLTSPTAVTATSVMNSSNGLVILNGAVAAAMTAFNISIDGSTAVGDAVIGSNSANDMNRGRIKVTGSFAAQFADTSISTLYDAETPITLIGMLVDNPSNLLSDFLTFVMGRVKITSDAPDDGEKIIVRTYNYTAEINLVGGGGSLPWDQTILTIQDSAA